MSQNQIINTLKKIIRVRQRLIDKGCSYKNKARCLNLITNLTNKIEFMKTATAKQLSNFTNNELENFLYLIPNNKSRDTICQQLDDIINLNNEV